MKSLPLKLGIGIVVVFGLLVAGMLCYPALRLKYYESRLNAKDEDAHRAVREALLRLGKPGREIVLRYFKRKMDSNYQCTGETLIYSGPFKNIDDTNFGNIKNIQMWIKNLSGSDIVLHDFKIEFNKESKKLYGDFQGHLPVTLTPSKTYGFEISCNQWGAGFYVQATPSGIRVPLPPGHWPGYYVIKYSNLFMHGEFIVEINGKKQTIPTRRHVMAVKKPGAEK